MIQVKYEHRGWGTGSGILDSWEISGLHQPHDIALSAAPTAATMGGSRTLAVYISETAHGRASRILKFVIHSPGACMPSLGPEPDVHTVQCGCCRAS